MLLPSCYIQTTVKIGTERTAPMHLILRLVFKIFVYTFDYFNNLNLTLIYTSAITVVRSREITILANSS